MNTQTTHANNTIEQPTVMTTTGTPVLLCCCCWYFLITLRTRLLSPPVAGKQNTRYNERFVVHIRVCTGSLSLSARSLVGWRFACGGGSGAEITTYQHAKAECTSLRPWITDLRLQTTEAPVPQDKFLCRLALQMLFVHNNRITKIVVQVSRWNLFVFDTMRWLKKNAAEVFALQIWFCDNSEMFQN